VQHGGQHDTEALSLIRGSRLPNTFHKDDIFTGTLAQLQAAPVAGSYCVTGQAAVASACTHASWVSSLCRVMRCSKTATKPVTYSETYVVEYQSGRWIVTSDALVQIS
jgi:hypothetical protein